MTAWTYPAVPRDESVVDVYASARHGHVDVRDPYRWLEDPYSPQTEAFVKDETAFLDGYLSTYPHRERLREGMSEMFAYTTVTAPEKQGDGEYYYFVKKELQNQPVLYHTRDTNALDAGQPFYDINAVRDPSGDCALTVFPGGRQPFSSSGKFWAYGVNLKGAAWTTVYVRPTSAPFTGADGEDGRPTAWAKIERVKFSSVAWNGDEGIFYQAYPAQSGKKSDGTELTQTVRSRLFYHPLGTLQSENAVVIEVDEAHPQWRYEPYTTEDTRYLSVAVIDAGRNARMWVTDLRNEQWKEGRAEWVKVDDKGESQWYLVINVGSVLYLLTNKDAPRFKLVTFDMSNPFKGTNDLVAEDPKRLLTTARLFGKHVLLSYSIDVHSEVWLASLDTGTLVTRLGPSEDRLYTVVAMHVAGPGEAYIETKGFTNPGLVWKISENGMHFLKESKIKDLRSKDYITKQVWYPSKDGTRIPMFLTHSVHLPISQPRPVLLFGYGGFGSLSSAPQFDAGRLFFVRAFNGILACPSIRGGGEYGKVWHLAGCRHERQTVFDDFQYAARYLIDQRLTTPKLLVAIGGSNGGLTVSACANQAPELFGGVIAASPILDMVRYTKFGIGKYGIQDIGDPDLPEDIDYILDWSPPHNVPSSANGARHPAFYLECGKNDDQVPALHSYKMTAALQHALVGKKDAGPVVVRIEEGAGHGQGRPTERLVRIWVDRLAFVAKALNLGVIL